MKQFFNAASKKIITPPDVAALGDVLQPDLASGVAALIPDALK